MSNILSLILQRTASHKIEIIYHNYLKHGTTSTAAIIAIFFQILSWTFFSLESPSWQWIFNNRGHWFSHISIHKPRTGDIIRYLIQSLWLIVICQNHQRSPSTQWLITIGHRVIKASVTWINQVPQKIKKNQNTDKAAQIFLVIQDKMHNILLLAIGFIALMLLLVCISQPFTSETQFIFIVLLWCFALGIRHTPGHFTVLLLVVLSCISTCRYLWWRYAYTLVWEDTTSAVFGILLIIAETYICLVMILGYFQSIWPLNRKPVALPQDISSWPTVDVFIPTYNEPLSVVQPGVYAALGLDWPKEKCNIYLLDDGNRPEFQSFAKEVGINYIARPNHDNAKAGNINYALKRSKGELVVIFDCDHIPTHTFLELTVGWFLKDPKLGLLQTAHHFFSPDPFERNLESFQNTPNEGALFYGVIQDGNDTWNAAYFCGSGGILRRSALEEINGFATESITEDAHTSLRIQRHGYNSAYIRIPLSAGLATESLSNHIGQRIRWAQGMAQILRLENPLISKGLTVPQRLCYFNAMLHFLSGIPRLIFLTTPIAFLVLHAYIIFAPALMVLLYVIPHIAHAALTNNRIQGKFRHFMWNEIYETVMAWYIAIPTTIALINPYKGKFNVTSKGGLVKERYADWVTARPYLLLIIFNSVGLFAGIWRLSFGPYNEIPAVIVTSLWVLYNILILGGALGVSIESKQIRQSPRVEFTMPAAMTRADGHAFPCILNNYSDNGVGIELNAPNTLQIGDKIHLLLKENSQREYAFPAVVLRIINNKIGVRLDKLSIKQNIAFIRCTFGRSDTWALWQNGFNQDRPIQSMRDVLLLDLVSYLTILKYTPPIVRKVLTCFTKAIIWAASFAPHSVQNVSGGLQKNAPSISKMNINTLQRISGESR